MAHSELLACRPVPAPSCLGRLLAVGALATLTLGLVGLAARLPPDRWLAAALAPDMRRPDELLFHYAALPRIALSLVAGAALGLAGAILSQLLRNPLAEPSTLGTSAGAGLALAAATLYAPGLLEHGRFAVALAGGLAATGAVLALAWRRRLEPVAVVLAGLVVGLACGAAGGAMALFNHEHLTAVFLWQMGALAPDGWRGVLGLSALLAAAGAGALALGRPLGALDLGAAGARAIGLPLLPLRLAGLGLAVALAAGVTAVVGVIGFVGLAAPALVRRASAGRRGPRMAASAAAGALLLGLADQAGQAAQWGLGADLPAGILTALFGAPLLLLLLLAPGVGSGAPHTPHAPAPGRRAAGATLPALAALCAAVALVALLLGRSSEGWAFAAPGDPVLGLRLPRVGAAVAAGMLLAVAGALLQRLTGNPMASPEVTGISSGAGLGALCAALVLPGLDRGDLLAGAGAGAAAAAAALLLAGRRSGFGSERLLLSGVALAAIGGAFSALVLAGNHPRLDLVLRLMAGSTYLVTAGEAAGSLLAAAAALAFLAVAARAVAVMGLGASNAQALGVPVPPARVTILLAASAATAAATLVVGPLSFAGLLAPHMARLLGLTRPLTQGIGGALIGGTLMAAADLAGRMLAFPWQIPAGLLCTLLGAPYFLWQMARRS